MTNNIPILLLPCYLQTYAFTLPLFFLPSLTPPLLLFHYHQHTHPPTTEAVVLFDYTTKHGNKLSLKMGDVITDVKQVCELHIVYSSKTYHIWSSTMANVMCQQQ